MNGYLKRILNARVYDVAMETPLEQAPNLSARIGNKVLLKREDMQPVFSFKLRGAYNKMAGLTKAQLKHGVVAASAGNHGRALAYAAAALGLWSEVWVEDAEALEIANEGEGAAELPTDASHLSVRAFARASARGARPDG